MEQLETTATLKKSSHDELEAQIQQLSSELMDLSQVALTSPKPSVSFRPRCVLDIAGDADQGQAPEEVLEVVFQYAWIIGDI